MNEAAIVQKLVDEVNAATASDVDVRTAGGDQDVSLPDVIIEWNTIRDSGRNGHKSVAGYITDQQSHKTGIEHHTYWQMDASCNLRSYSEAERDAMIDAVRSHFVPFESDAGLFNDDTYEWEVTAGKPRDNQVIEPDWYESGVVLNFGFVTRADETGKDHIDTINQSVE